MFGRRFFSTDRKLLRGALLYDATFSRIMGTRNTSEPILIDLLAAWRAALTGKPAGACAVASLEIMDRTVLGNALRSRGELIVDLRMQDDEGHMIVEVQHRAEPLSSSGWNARSSPSAASRLSTHTHGPAP